MTLSCTHHIDTSYVNDYMIYHYKTTNINDIVMAIPQPVHGQAVHIYEVNKKCKPYAVREVYVIVDDFAHHIVFAVNEPDARPNITLQQVVGDTTGYTVETITYQEQPYISFRVWLLKEYQEGMYHVQVVDNACETYDLKAVKMRYRIFNDQGIMIGSVPCVSEVSNIRELLNQCCDDIDGWIDENYLSPSIQ